MANDAVPSNNRLSRRAMAARLAQDIPGGWFVNLGIGLPNLVSDFVPPEREVVFHSENGILGMGPAPAPDKVSRWLVNAGKQPVTLVTGGSYVHQADSFGIIRGGHLDLCVLGAYEVSADGSFANWATSNEDAAPAVGGAMDLAVGAKRIWLLMEQTTKAGESRLVTTLRYPATAHRVVQRVYTDLAIYEITPRGFVVRERLTEDPTIDLQALVGAPLVEGQRERA